MKMDCPIFLELLFIAAGLVNPYLRYGALLSKENAWKLFDEGGRKKNESSWQRMLKYSVLWDSRHKMYNDNYTFQKHLGIKRRLIIQFVKKKNQASLFIKALVFL